MAWWYALPLLFFLFVAYCIISIVPGRADGLVVMLSGSMVIGFIVLSNFCHIVYIVCVIFRSLGLFVCAHGGGCNSDSWYAMMLLCSISFFGLIVVCVS